ncbi:MAG TPA: polysaccharide deacetylase family protein [Candidatus Acidoferrales bacterium]|jgi:peptidoglycan/xylan/chitin deacetylase (PgdA/CDA1 family)|nr:polysaccharide deacetylase family protein [Candidatus Acidoferrales bacterium]
MHRREFLQTVGTLAAASVLPLSTPAPERPRIAVTMDDPSTSLSRNISWKEANRNILDTLEKWNLKIALFVCGMRIDSAAGKELVSQWDEAGHLICNHSYSHFNFNSPTQSYDDFAADFERNEPLITHSRRFTRLFRYPGLKEGDTADKRDRFRDLLKQKGYAVGHVTVDASDWYVDDRMNARLDQSPATDTQPYGDYLVAHLLDRAAFYRQLALDVLSHEIPHTLLLHHRMINAVYLEDVIRAFSDQGWQWIDAHRAYDDPIFKRQPQTLPAGESLVWALAKESGRFEDRLRYPGESDTYEKPKMDALGL